MNFQSRQRLKGSSFRNRVFVSFFRALFLLFCAAAGLLVMEDKMKGYLLTDVSTHNAPQLVFHSVSLPTVI